MINSIDKVTSQSVITEGFVRLFWLQGTMISKLHKNMYFILQNKYHYTYISSVIYLYLMYIIKCLIIQSNNIYSIKAKPTVLS